MEKSDSTTVLFIRGAPGVGKSSVVERLRLFFPSGVTIETDSVRTLLHKVDYKDASQYQDAFLGAGLLSIHFRECGFKLIFVVGHISDSLLAKWVDIGAGEPTCVYTLLASESVLCSRLASRREYGFISVESSYRVPNKLLPLQTCEEVFIDTTALDVEGVCRVVCEDMFKRKTPRVDEDFVFGAE